MEEEEWALPFEEACIVVAHQICTRTSEGLVNYATVYGVDHHEQLIEALKSQEYRVERIRPGWIKIEWKNWRVYPTALPRVI